MKFLSVFCVVLYLHTGVTSVNENNGPNIPCDQSKNVEFESNDGAKHNQLNSIDSPSSLNWQQTKANEDSGGGFIKKNSNGPFIRSEEITSEPPGSDVTSLSLKSNKNKEVERIDLSVQNPTDTLLSRTLLRDLAKGKNLQNEVLVNRSYQPNKKTSSSNLPIDNIKSTVFPNTYNEPEFINSDRNVMNNYQNQPRLNKLPQKSGERIRLDAQGVPLEKIKSLIRMSALGNPSEISNFNLHKDSYHSLRYIINNAKKLHDIHSSAKNLKRYMVLHPDGTVEHIDKIGKIAKRYPNHIAIKSVDLGKYITHIPASPTSNEQKPNKETNSKTLNYVNFDEPSKNEESNHSSLVKDNSSSEVFVNTVNKIENQLNIHKNKIPGTANLNNQDETVQNVSIVPLAKYSTETTPKQDSTNTIYIPKISQIPENTELENIITVPPNSEVTLTVKNGNNHKSSFTLLPLNGHQNKKDSPSSPCSQDVDDTGLWFRDKNFWEKLTNDSHNVFFMFASTSPLVKKETKTTLYVNGTTVEEVIDIVDDRDGIPVATKTTKITHAADASLEAKEA